MYACRTKKKSQKKTSARPSFVWFAIGTLAGGRYPGSTVSLNTFTLRSVQMRIILCVRSETVIFQSHMWMRHVIHMNESCDTNEGIMTRKWMRRITSAQFIPHKYIFKCTSHTHTSTHSFFLSLVYTISALMCRFLILFASQTCYAIVCQCQWSEQQSWLDLDFVGRAWWKREGCWFPPTNCISGRFHNHYISQTCYVIVWLH